MDISNKDEKYSDKGEKEAEKEQEKENNNKLTDKTPPNNVPRGNVVFRQELTNHTPECGYKCAIIFNILLIVVFTGCGLPIITMANSITEFVKEYSNW